MSPLRTGASNTRRATALAATLVAAVLASCSTDGRTLAPSLPSQTESVAIAPVETTVAVPEASFAVAGPWVEGGDLDTAYTCFGAELSPPLQITAPPPGTVSMAVLLYDVDSAGELLWVMANLSATTVAIGEGSVPPDVILATNGDGSLGYQPPCPPNGERRQYLLTVFALDAVVDAAAVTAADGTVDGEALLTAIETNAFDLAESTFYVQAP